jgi:hypothetical protein
MKGPVIGVCYAAGLCSFARNHVIRNAEYPMRRTNKQNIYTMIAVRPKYSSTPFLVHPLDLTRLWHQFRPSLRIQRGNTSPFQILAVLLVFCNTGRIMLVLCLSLLPPLSMSCNMLSSSPIHRVPLLGLPYNLPDYEKCNWRTNTRDTTSRPYTKWK